MSPPSATIRVLNLENPLLTDTGLTNSDSDSDCHCQIPGYRVYSSQVFLNLG